MCPVKEELNCHKCNHNRIKLISGDGWYCKKCDDGPYIVTPRGLIYMVDWNSVKLFNKVLTHKR